MNNTVRVRQSLFYRKLNNVGWVHKILKSPIYGEFFSGKDHLSDVSVERVDDLGEELLFESRSGAVISAVLFRADESRQKATLILGHPACVEGKQYFIDSGYAAYMKGNGFNVIAFDFNGFGESTHGNFLFHEDILAAGKKAKELFPDLPLGYHGVCMGAHWGINAFNDYDHRYSFAVLESPADSWKKYWSKSFKTRFMTSLLLLLKPTLRKNSKMLQRAATMKNIQSILFIYSESDIVVPFETGELYRSKCKLFTEIWTVPEGENGKIMNSPFKEEYVKKVALYFDQQQLHFYKRNHT